MLYYKVVQILIFKVNHQQETRLNYLEPRKLSGVYVKF